MATEKELLYGGDAYTGEDTSNAAPFQVDYYRNKVREFQVHLNTLAATADALVNLRDQVTDAQARGEIDEWLDDFQSKKSALFAAAEAVNFAAEGANAVGIRFPVLSVPQQFGLAPVAIAAIAAAVAGTAWAISYAVDAVAAARALIARNEAAAMLPEEQRAAFLAADQQIARAQASAESGLGAVASAVKWIALAVAGWFAYKAISEATR